MHHSYVTRKTVALEMHSATTTAFGNMHQDALNCKPSFRCFIKFLSKIVWRVAFLNENKRKDV